MFYFYIQSPRLVDAQLRSAWSTFRAGCAVLNTERSKLNIIVSLITDVILLLIGLLRLRREGSGRFSIGLLLWNQVGSWDSFLTSCARYRHLLTCLY